MYLKKSYWGEVENGRLAAYRCPYQFCHYKSDLYLPGCKFDPDRVDGQCAHNRTGILCGRCKKNFSVGLNIALNLGFSLGLERWHFNLMAFHHIYLTYITVFLLRKFLIFFLLFCTAPSVLLAPNHLARLNFFTFLTNPAYQFTLSVSTLPFPLIILVLITWNHSQWWIQERDPGAPAPPLL